MKEKFFKFSQMLVAMAAFAIVFTMGGDSTKAASYGYVSNIMQTAQTETSVTISWTHTGPGVDYIGYSTDPDSGNAGKQAKAMAESRQIAVPKGQTSYTISNLAPHSTVCFAIGTPGYKNSMYASTKHCKTQPGVAVPRQKEWYRAALTCWIEWDKQACADGYEYIFTDSRGNVIDQGTCTGGTFSEPVKNNKIYKVQIRAYSDINNRQEQRVYSEWSPWTYLMTQPGAKPRRGQTQLGLDVHVSGGKLIVDWEKVDDVSGYYIYIATKKGGKFTKVKTCKASTGRAVIKKFKKKKFKSNKKYYVFVQSFKDVNGQRYNSGMNYISYNNGRYSSFIYAQSWN
ncbi:fibronectin type III domain-containing protein [Butyrivibrio sp. INlla16]|uniref:fibronectin type III domain-containing protein n=1 Tax=Butyrivibrio sp. INlla16 TaxID=1520807 RepID=UPI0008893FFE|nr:fibronectin type III domain-containing protein [Butyrivibrio sp. INlla16]SDB32748.1 hypothetical protein SAMN02910263_01584 [Butyrivibrio sp. INlla16]